MRWTNALPREERCALSDQVRRSSRAVAALVAEAGARRRYRAAFVNKTNEAIGEAYETQAWLNHALRSGYLDEPEHQAFDAAWSDLGVMFYRMLQQADRFVPLDVRPCA